MAVGPRLLRVPLYTPAPKSAELPLTVQLVIVSVPPLYRPPARKPAELPLTVQLVSVVVPKFSRPPPSPVVVPPLIVSPEMDAVTVGSTRNTRLALLPLTVTPAAGPAIVTDSFAVLSSSWVPPRVIVCGVLKNEPNTIVFAPPAVFARPIS